MTSDSTSGGAIRSLPEAPYFTDVLCVWAWIAQPRFEEVVNNWSEKLSIKSRFIDVFGDAHGKILGRWGAADGFDRFADHVQEAASGHPHLDLHEGLWRTVRPTGSGPAHAHIHGVSLVSDPGTARRYDRAVRAAFFEAGEDVSRTEVLIEIAAQTGVDSDALGRVLSDGRAQAALAADQKAAQSQRIVGSPTWVLNDGRQILYGNVGYRTINANLEEWFRDGASGASWC